MTKGVPIRLLTMEWLQIDTVGRSQRRWIRRKPDILFSLKVSHFDKEDRITRDCLGKPRPELEHERSFQHLAYAMPWIKAILDGSHNPGGPFGFGDSL